ncbi:M23 family metallopeptidase [Microbacterium sp. NPDC058269]|uniref:M23 family metallopeptidase n=1 Tax=Microbacterium sp. NPDC058269 TaxID=3346414 RepID=UPI0036DAF6A2
MSLAYRHPFTESWFVPAEGEWGNRASWRSYPPHAGVDYNISGGSAGKTIRAIADGYIRGKGVHTNYGNRVYIEHDDGMWSHYAHMQNPSPKNNGDRVTLGTPIGNVGNTGLSFGAHLHLEMATTAGRCHDGNTSIDPITFINNNPGTPTPGPGKSEENMEAIVKVPNGTIVHLRYGGKTDFSSVEQYNTFRQQVDTLRSLGATDVMALPELSKVPGVAWDTFSFLAGYIGAPAS